MLGFLLVDEASFAVDPSDGARFLGPDAATVLRAAHGALARLDSWAADDLRESLQAALVDGLRLKRRAAFGGALRVAVTGRRAGPPLFESMELLGRERTLARLTVAVA